MLGRRQSNLGTEPVAVQVRRAAGMPVRATAPGYPELGRGWAGQDRLTRGTTCQARAGAPTPDFTLGLVTW